MAHLVITQLARGYEFPFPLLPLEASLSQTMYDERHRTGKEIRELKSTISEQRICIMLLLCSCIILKFREL